MGTKNTKDTKSTESTTIRIDASTKNSLENLDFVRKHTFNEILIELIGHYKKYNGVKK